ncbi:hypothetical protein B0H14DRAFT_2568321 [Mycena olivaceomarginata]|nr:hypothetical protein B0H14DRAFT_2568321 [Mycena olivaceomarginata]
MPRSADEHRRPFELADDDGAQIQGDGQARLLGHHPTTLVEPSNDIPGPPHISSLRGPHKHHSQLLLSRVPGLASTPRPLTFPSYGDEVSSSDLRWYHAYLAVALIYILFICISAYAVLRAVLKPLTGLIVLYYVFLFLHGIASLI